MTQTIRVKNISGDDREVPLPNGHRVTVAANHSEEFEAEHARDLLQQKDVWERYQSKAKADDAKDKE